LSLGFLVGCRLRLAFDAEVCAAKLTRERHLFHCGRSAHSWQPARPVEHGVEEGRRPRAVLIPLPREIHVDGQDIVGTESGVLVLESQQTPDEKRGADEQDQ
jgi:hypothetical protein